MLNFSYSFNKAKRNSYDKVEHSHLHPSKSIFRKRSDSIERGYFPTGTEYRDSVGGGSIVTDFRTNSSCSAPDSPISANRSSNTANTSVVSHPIIDLNEVQKKTSRFKRSLSYPSQSAQNRSNSRDMSKYKDMPFDYQFHRYTDYPYFPWENHEDLDNFHMYTTRNVSAEKKDKTSSSKNETNDEASDITIVMNDKGLKLDEVLFANESGYSENLGVKPRSAGRETRLFPDTSENLLSRLQLKNAGIIEVVNDDDEDDDENKEEKERNDKKSEEINRRQKNGRKKKTFISRTISRLNPGSNI